MWCVDYARRCGALLLLCGSVWAADEMAEQLTRGELAFNRGDLGEAILIFRQSAQKGYAPAQSRLAYVLDKAEENEEALEWYRKAADQGDASGQFGLGQMLSLGEGAGRDPATGLQWMRRAAAQGYLPAIVATARVMEEGDKSLRDPTAAFGMWAQAAGMGDHSAMRRLVNAYRNGELGQATDEAQAKSWEARLPPDPNARSRKRK